MISVSVIKTDSGILVKFKPNAIGINVNSMTSVLD